MTAKRLTSIILCAVMMITLVPFTSHADNGPFRGVNSFAFAAFFEIDGNGDVICAPYFADYFLKTKGTAVMLQ